MEYSEFDHEAGRLRRASEFAGSAMGNREVQVAGRGSSGPPGGGEPPSESAPTDPYGGTAELFNDLTPVLPEAQ